MSTETAKMAAANAAIQYIDDDMIVGVGTGSTANHFIEALANIKGRIEGTVASSEETARRLKEKGIAVFDLNSAPRVDIYVDGADAIDPYLHLTKGGGGALMREKIVAACADKFICIADDSKQVDFLGEFPIPLEVIPMARSYVGREILKLGGDPAYREGFVTDNGNIIIDVHHLKVEQAFTLEKTLNNIVGVVCCGIFAAQKADLAIIGHPQNSFDIVKPKAK